MKKEIFNALIEALIFNKGNGIDNFGFSANHSSYCLSFSLVDGALHIDDFGMKSSKGWEQFEPNDSQIKIMQSKIDEVVAVWDFIFHSEGFSEPNGNNYDLNGVKESDFY